MPTTQTADIAPLLRPEHICIGLDASTKDDVINHLVDLVHDQAAIQDVEAVRRAIFEREAKMSTGVGKGLGLPHAKTDAATETVAAFATIAAPVDFDAIDNEPVRLVLMLVGPASDKSHHIKLLSRIMRLVSRDDFRERLLTTQTSDAVAALFREGEARLHT